MDELIARITSNVGIDAETAKKAVGMIIGFLQQEGPQEDVNKMMAAMPGAQQVVDESPDASGGVMGLGAALMGIGLGMGEISGVSKETVAYAKEHAGEEPVDRVIASIPGLSQFV